MPQLGTPWNETIAKFIIESYSRPFESVFDSFPDSDVVHRLSEEMLRCTEPQADSSNPYDTLLAMPDDSFHLICFDAYSLLNLNRSEQQTILEHALRALTPGGYCCFLISDGVSHGKIVPHGFQLVHRFLANGFRVESIYDHNADSTLPFRIMPHQYLAVFQKPSERKKKFGTASFNGVRRPRLGVL